MKQGSTSPTLRTPPVTVTTPACGRAAGRKSSRPPLADREIAEMPDFVVRPDDLVPALDNGFVHCRDRREGPLTFCQQRSLVPLEPVKYLRLQNERETEKLGFTGAARNCEKPLANTSRGDSCPNRALALR
jgi:hypothetical protein